MKNKSILVYLIIALALISRINAKGGRGGGGGGRGGGRGGGSRSSSGGSRWSFFGGSSKSGSSSSGTKIQHSPAQSNNGGLFHGFIASRPYHFSYSPIHIGGSHYASDTQHRSSYSDDNNADEQKYFAKSGDGHSTNIPDYSNKDETEYAVGYTISKALSNDFFSIFNVVHDISKYPQKIKNKEFLTSTSTSTTTTTTEAPVSMFDSSISTNVISEPDSGTDYLKMLENADRSEATENKWPTFDDWNSPSSIFGSNQRSSTDIFQRPDDFFHFLKELDNLNFPKIESEEHKNANTNSQTSSYDINNLMPQPDSGSDYVKILENLGVSETKENKIPQNEYFP